jgi:hypothetical protein
MMKMGRAYGTHEMWLFFTRGGAIRVRSCFTPGYKMVRAYGTGETDRGWK